MEQNNCIDTKKSIVIDQEREEQPSWLKKSGKSRCIPHIEHREFRFFECDLPIIDQASQ